MGLQLIFWQFFFGPTAQSPPASGMDGPVLTDPRMITLSRPAGSGHPLQSPPRGGPQAPEGVRARRPRGAAGHPPRQDGGPPGGVPAARPVDGCLFDLSTASPRSLATNTRGFHPLPYTWLPLFVLTRSCSDEHIFLAVFFSPLASLFVFAIFSPSRTVRQGHGGGGHE